MERRPQLLHPSLQQTPAQYLLPEAKAQDVDKICVVIDLDETLVHSSFKVGPAQQPSAPWVSEGGLPWTGGCGPLCRPRPSSSFSPHSQ